MRILLHIITEPYSGGSLKVPPQEPPTLAEMGIDKKLSARSQRIAGYILGLLLRTSASINIFRACVWIRYPYLLFNAWSLPLPYYLH